MKVLQSLLNHETMCIIKNLITILLTIRVPKTTTIWCCHRLRWCQSTSSSGLRACPAGLRGRSSRGWVRRLPVPVRGVPAAARVPAARAAVLAAVLHATPTRPARQTQR